MNQYHTKTSCVVFWSFKAFTQIFMINLLNIRIHTEIFYLFIHVILPAISKICKRTRSHLKFSLGSMPKAQMTHNSLCFGVVNTKVFALKRFKIEKMKNEWMNEWIKINIWKFTYMFSALIISSFLKRCPTPNHRQYFTLFLSPGILNRYWGTLDPKFQIWVHHSPVATEFTCGSCVIFAYISLERMAAWSSPFHWDHFSPATSSFVPPLVQFPQMFEGHTAHHSEICMFSIISLPKRAVFCLSNYVLSGIFVDIFF